jgi:hypothetical protein
MADQVEVTKLNQLVAIGADDDEEAVSKLVVYYVIFPSNEIAENTGQGHVHTQLITRS